MSVVFLFGLVLFVLVNVENKREMYVAWAFF